MNKRLEFPIFNERLEEITNYDLFMKPNGVYRARSIKADNYLYPMYYLNEGKDYVVSTSVYGLIRYKRRFIRNPRFQTTYFYRPTFLTIDKEINRARTEYRRSTLELKDKDDIVKLGARLMQEYVTEIEEKYPGWVHILLMGGRDSKNIILAKRKAKWIALTAHPSIDANKAFLKNNAIELERFVPVENKTDNTFLAEEIVASDCSFDVAHFRWVKELDGIIREFGGKAIIWIGTDGDGIFSKNNNHKDRDYYALHDLHVGTAMGVWHQMLKNVFNIPVVSPYQSPQFLNELFYKFDPKFVDKWSDVRDEIGNILFGKKVWYPQKTGSPEMLKRKRSRSIPIYISRLKSEYFLCECHNLESFMVRTKERIISFFDRHSVKMTTPLAYILFPAREILSRSFPVLKNNRCNIAAREIK